LLNLPQDPKSSLELGGEVLQAALELVAGGVRVFPTHSARAAIEPDPTDEDGAPRVVLRCTCGRPACPNPAKHPVGHLVPHGHNDATTDVLRVRSWFGIPDAVVTGDRADWVPWNLGVACGRGLVVIDADVKQTRTDLPNGLEVLDDWESWTKGTSLPALPHVTMTGSRGLHLWLRVDPNLRIASRNRVLPGIDVKADGGYVLAPPSLHISGGSYRVLHDREYPLCDPELVTWLLTVKGNRYVTRRAGSGAVQVPDDYDFRRIIAGDGCPAGHRDYFVNDLCFRLRRAGSSIDDAAEALRREWQRMENPANDEFPWETCVYKLRRVWDEVTPEDVADVPAWRPPSGLIGNGAAPPGSGGGAAGLGQGGVPGLGAAVPLDESTVQGRTAVELLNRPELTLKRTDTGNGERFAQRMRDVVRYCTGEGRWYLWDGSRWAPDTLNRVLFLTGEIIKDLYVEAATLDGPERERHEAWAQSSQSAGRRDAMLRIAAAQPGIAVNPDQFDADPWLLATRNGVVNLRTQAPREFAPDDLITRRAEVSFDASAACPQWLDHVRFVTRGDAALAAWLRRAVGYTLTGLTGEQQLFFLWGTGDNGKSTFLDVVLRLLGSYANIGDENLLTSTSAHPTQLADLRGSRLIVCDETDREKKLAEQRIKMMTGKQIKARYMRQDFFTYTPRFKVWISGNHKPEIKGGDDGIWRRLRLVPFTAKLNPDTKILDYEETLAAELPGILNWALVGLADWVKLGQLGGTAAVDDATVEYREEEDHIGQWILENCEVVDGVIEDTTRLFASWSYWAVSRGYEVGNATRLGRELTTRGFAPANDGKTIRIDGRVTRGRVGLRLLGVS
jgi:P4 family phage/plasmid primase-like protien